MMLKSDISNEDKMDLQFTRDKNRDSQEQELLDVDDASDSEEAIQLKPFLMPDTQIQ